MFQVGDEVIIKDIDYLRDHRSQSPTINSTMMQAAGELCTVKRVAGSIVELQGNRWMWHESWLIPADTHEVSEKELADFLDS